MESVNMKSLLRSFSYVLLFIFAADDSFAQSKLFGSVGGAYTLGGNFTTTLATAGGWTLDLEWDKKVMGTLHVVSGLSVFSVGYDSKNTSFGSNTSKFNADYIALPIMARWNAANRNFINLDMGFVTYYLAYA